MKKNPKDVADALLVGTPRELPRPSVPAAHNGVGLGWDQLSDPDRPVIVQVFYPNIQERDIIRLYWNGVRIMHKEVSIEGVQAFEVFERAIPDGIPDGPNEVLYGVADPIDPENETLSLPLSLLVKRSLPGGFDPNPEDNINRNLLAPTGIPAVITPEIAREGIPVGIPAYDNKEPGDTIRLSWHGYLPRLEYTVLDRDAPVTITVPESVIVAAGDTQNLVVRYEIRDVVNNWSRWSQEATGVVEVDPNALTAPRVVEAVGDVIDLDALDGKGVTVRIPHYTGMQPDDEVALIWAGQTEGGTPVDPVVVPHTVKQEDVDFGLTLPIAHADVAKLAQGQVLVRYTVNRTGTPEQASRAVVLRVVGESAALLPPRVLEAVGDELDPDRVPASGATVEIAPNSFMVPGATVRLNWLGRAADNTLYPITDSKPIFGGDAGSPVRFVVAKTQIEQLAGGTVTATYTVITFQLEELTSPELELRVLAEQALLPEPSVDYALGDRLDPADVPTGGTNLRVPATAETQDGDTVRVFWTGPANSGADSFTEFLPINAGTEGKPIAFPVVRRYVEANVDQEVVVRYQIERSGATLPSTLLRLQVGAAELPMLEAASVVEAVNGILDPSKLTTKATAKIPAYDGMDSGDYIHMTWGGGSGSGGLEWFIDVTGNMAGRPILRDIPLANITPFEGRNVELVYTVDTGQPPVRESEAYSVRVQRESLQLAAPRVPAVNNGVLDPRDVVQGAEVLVDRQTGMQQGDTIRLHWDCSIPAGSYTRDELVGSSQNPVLFTVPAAHVQAGVNGGVNALYELLRGGQLIGTSDALEFAIRQSALPLPVITQANGQTLDPDDVPAGGATVMLAASALFKRNDQILLTWAGAPGGGSGTYPHTVSAAEDGSIVNITVPKSVVEANNGGTVTLTYSVTRAAGGPPEYSDPNIYDVRRELGSGDLLVMGARYNGSIYRASGAAQYLRALNRTTRADLLAEWRYEDEPTWTTGVSLKDTRPWVALRVRSQTHQVTINAANIVGSGADSVGTTGVAAVVALLARKNVIGWGDSAYGGNVPPTIITYTDVEEVSSTQSAFAVRRTNGRVAVWGNTEQGGAIPDGGGSIVDAVRIQGNGSAFVAVRGNGYLTAWGTAVAGGTLSTEAQGLADVAFVATSGTAFCALRRNRQVVAWGTAASGGTVPGDIKALTDISDVRGNYTAFVALRANSTVVAWGTAADGGTVPDVIAARTDIIELASASARAFAVRTQGGQVLAWGNANYGGTVPGDIAALTDIEEVTATWGAFCARRGNGSVVAWGDTARGGTVPADIAVLTDIVQVVGTGAAFAALRRNGTVVTWGQATAGGDSSSVVGQLVNIHAVYSNSQAFIALKAAGGVVTWGIAASGGDSSSVRTILDANLFYQATAGGLSYSSEKGRAILAMAG
ncbi:RCC1 domain-containing protein [Burkholderia ubonensis]|uniref:RCC1 domain-containing protein n=1 Tax=Burkholderia ubonensis TaxID=101571 RepID=UPI000A591746|nr:hypothetical protein [Burkholderia ubonensis]